MNKKTREEKKHEYKELMNMKLEEILAILAYHLEEQGATEGDVGRIEFDNKYYGFSITVVKKEEDLDEEMIVDD